MSKELIDRLKSYIPSGDGHNSQYANDMADAVSILEAKAAPVGEREAFEAWAASVGYHTERDMFQREKYQSTLTWELWRVWQAGAAYQRAQQPQSAEAVAWQHKKPIENDRGETVGYSTWIDGKGLGWWPHRPLYTTPQPSAGVVMPDVSAMEKVLSDRSADACNIDRGDNWAMYGQEYIDDVEAMLSAASLNGKEVGRG